MDNMRAGLTIRSKMSDAKKGRAELYEKIADAKGKSLDESPNTEDKRTQTILDLLDQIGTLYQHISKSTSTWKLIIFPTSKTISVKYLSSILDDLLQKISHLKSDMRATTNARGSLDKVGDLAFRNNFSDNNDLSRLSSRMSVWSLSSGLEELSTRADVYQSLQLTESDFNTWWYGLSLPREESLVLDDLKRLCIRIVEIKDKVAELDAKKNPVHEPLQELVEVLKEATIILVDLLVQHPSQEVFLSSIFTHILLATFATSKVALGAEDTIQSSIPLLQLITHKVLKLCKATKDQLKQESPNTTVNDDVAVDTEDERLGIASALSEAFNSEAQVRSLFDGLKRIIQRPKAQPSACLSKPFIEVKPLGLEDLHKLDLHPVPLSTQNPRRIGEGAFSAVYRYSSVDGEKMYAVKRPFTRHGDKDEEFARRAWNRIVREAECLVRCTHGNVVRLHGYYEIPDFPFPGLVMDEYEMSLEKLIRNKGDTMSIEQRLRILNHVASGLSHVHKNECVHGDLRAANVLVRTKASGTDWFVALADFGVSSVPDMQESLSVNTVQKTNDYWLAPEYFTSPGQEIRPPADIYAFGCVVLEVLADRKPYYYADSQRLSVHQLKRRRDLPARDDAFGKRKGYSSFVRKACAYNPGERPSVEVLNERIEDLRERATLGD